MTDSIAPAEPKREKHKGEGHRKRLREKFLTNGLSGFHDYEVIELLLTLAMPRKDCKETAKAALKRFGSLAAVMEASASQLCQVKNIGPRNLLGIKLVKAVAERYMEQKVVKSDPISNSQELYSFLRHRLQGRRRECFEVLYLDAKNRVIAVETLFRGTLTASSVYPREVIRAALEHHAAALIFAHNHPSGDPQPSAEDIAITRKLITACRVMAMTVHEHLIIGNGEYFSFADQGYIADMNRSAE